MSRTQRGTVKKERLTMTSRVKKANENNILARSQLNDFEALKPLLNERKKPSAMG